MINLNLIFLVAFFFSLSSVNSRANTPKIVCGGTPGSSAFEIDHQYSARGVSVYQLVLRDRNILAHFTNQNVTASEYLNEKEELIAVGSNIEFAPIDTGSFRRGTIDSNEFIACDTDYKTGALSLQCARYWNQNKLAEANFYFGDCYKLN